MKRLKYGRLYWLPLEADDIDRFLWVRALRKFGVAYIPLTLGRYQELYLREDRSPFSRRLIQACRKKGITTYVVQEGPIYHSHQAKWSHVPLHADIFLCPPADEPVWIEHGMPKERIKTYDPQRPVEEFKRVVFIPPFITWEDGPDLRNNVTNGLILRAVYAWMDKDVMFRPDPKHAELITPFLPPHRVVQGTEQEVLSRYERVDLFPSALPAAKPGSEAPEHAGEPDAVALLGSFVTWNDLGFTWRKDLHNARVFESLAELADKNVLLKPHPAHAKLLLPFLPPDRVIWENANSLIKRFDNIYCFWDSSVRKDCEMLGKVCQLIGNKTA